MKKSCIALFIGIFLLSCNLKIVNANNYFSEKEINWLNNIVSFSEKQRFVALNKIEIDSKKLNVINIEKYFKTTKSCYIGTFIYWLLNNKNEILYQFKDGGIEIFSKYAGYFPNSAKYFSELNSTKGFRCLIKLYGLFPDNRLQICQAIGSSKKKEAKDFLTSKISENILKKQGYYNEVTGLASADWTIDKNIILKITGNTDDREILFAAANIKSNFSDDDLISLWSQSDKEKLFTMEYILNNFVNKQDLYFSIIDKLIANKNYDFARQLLLGDKIRSMNNTKVNEYLKKLD